MLEDDGFIFDDDMFAADLAITPVGLAQNKIIETFEETISKLKPAIRLGEDTEVSNLIQRISYLTEALITLDNLDSDEMSEEELESKIDEIFKTCTTITFSNMDEILPEVEIEEGTNNSFTDDSEDF